MRPRPLYERYWRDQAHLRGEHGRLAVRFDDLVHRAMTGTCRDCDVVWDSFCTDLETHMQLEEEEIFPVFVAEGPQRAALVQQLTDDHASIRRQLGELGIEIQLHVLRAARVEQFVASMRAHALREDESVHPWLDADEPLAGDAAFP